jgi:hypothetical protein
MKLTAQTPCSDSARTRPQDLIPIGMRPSRLEAERQVTSVSAGQVVVVGLGGLEPLT